MITVGKRVRVKDNYSGGLDNVAGRTGKVVRISTDGLYLLDFKGKRASSSGNYYWDWDAIVKDDEVEVADFDIRDSEGRKIEVGDVLVYGPLGGGVTRGVVVDVDEREGRYGHKAVKFRLEIETSDRRSDGGDRSVDFGTSKTYRWFEHGGRALIISKTFSAADDFVLKSVPVSW